MSRTGGSRPRGMLAVLACAVLAVAGGAGAVRTNRLLAAGNVAAATSSGAATVHTTLTVSWADQDPLNYPRRLVTVNGMFPSPTLEYTEGDTVNILVENRLDVGTAVHWHGLKYSAAHNDQDGVPFVTQHLIPVGKSMLYNFTVDVPGTYWYHGHYDMQLTDGFKGAYIVRPKGVTPLKNQLVLTMSDWYHGRGKVLLTDDFLVPASGGAESVPDGALFNGIGQADCTPIDTPGDLPPCAYSRLMVTPGGSAKNPNILLRLISVASFAAFNVTIDGHNMRVVAVDSVPIVPVNVGHIRMNTGQRYDVLLSRTDGGFGKGAFWIRGQFDQAVFGHPSTAPKVLAILQYNTNPNAGPTSTYNAGGYSLGGRYTEQGYYVDPYGLVSTAPGIYPVPAANVTLDTQIIFRANSKGVVLGTFDNRPWELTASANTPTLLEVVKAGGNQSSFPWSAPSHSFNLGDSVRIFINNTDGGEHPLHLHGQDFYVLGRGRQGDGAYDPARDTLNTKNPIVRDVATIAGTSWIVLQFQATRQGIWMFHCHIEWHMSAGLAMVFVVGY